MSQSSDDRNDAKPFNIENCIVHRSANSYGVPLNFTDKCQCCQRYSSKKPLSCNFSIHQLNYCGPQMASYFLTLEYLLLVLLLLMLAYGLPLTIVNCLGNGCDNLNCSGSLFLTSSVFNSFNNTNNLALNSYLLIGCQGLFILFSLFLRFKLRELKRNASRSHYFPTEFGVFCKLPSSNINQYQIADGIENWWKKEVKSNKQVMKGRFPEFYEKQRHSEEGQQQKQDLWTIKRNNEINNSHIIQKIIFSYNYLDFCSTTTEIQALVEEFISQSAIKNEQDVQRLKEMYEKKKNLLKQILTNNYCLIIFKLQQYAQYFYQKTSPTIIEQLLCFENYRHFQIQNTNVETINGLFPTEIYWNNHHLTKRQKFQNRIAGWIIYFLLLAIGCGLIFLSSYSLKNYVSSDFLATYHFLIIAVSSNIFVICSNKIILLLHKREKYNFYHEQQSMFIIKSVLFQFCLFVLSPLLSYEFTNMELSANINFLKISVTSIIIFMCFTHLNKYLSSSSISLCYFSMKMAKLANYSQIQANQKITKPNQQIQQQYSYVISIVFCSLFVAPFSPNILLLTFTWMLFHFIFQRINIACFNRQDTPHGTYLNYQMLSVLQKSPFFLILGNVAAIILLNNNNEVSLMNITIIINSILFLISSLNFILPTESINEWIFSQKQQNQEDKTKYQDAKAKFLMSYEDFNQPLICGMKGKSQPMSTKAKIFQQMNTMSKTLTLSLKERLMGNQNPIYNHLDRIVEPQSVQINNLYFEYEKKVFMNKPKSKVKVPPLFQKQQPQIQKPQLIDFYNVFSGSDSSAKRILKQHIKNKVAKQFLQEKT